ncbi:unnamed protein product [Zymoseptoria tritici ST99CH_3D1]|nr:unnamed protein product [Zymoseptoria tritici ST99CH_3D1]
MKFSFSFVAAMALPMVSGAYNPHLDHFDISFNRFQSDKCQSQSLEHGDGATIHQEKCHHWDDGQTFDSFTFTYFADKYWSPDELPTDRDCAVLIYEYDHCGGRLLLDRDQANLPENLGKCWWLHGMKGRSAKITCRKRGEAADWEKERAWKTPMVVTIPGTVVPISTTRT